jgi:hypothetical protein
MTMPVLIGLRPPVVMRDMIAVLKTGIPSSSETLVCWGLRPELPTQRERVYLLGVTEYTLSPNTRAHRVRREDFAIRGLIEVQELGAGGPEAASTRAWELLSKLDSTLYIEQSMESGVRYSGVLAVSGDEVVPATDGWLARIIFTLAMEAVR